MGGVQKDRISGVIWVRRDWALLLLWGSRCLSRGLESVMDRKGWEERLSTSGVN